MADNERGELHEAIQACVSDHESEAGLVTKWLFVAEVAEPSGRRWLLHRSGNVEGDPLQLWEAIGLLESDLATAKAQLLEITTDAGDDPPDV